ncbi:MAG: nicotinate phosphoribosyltransferase [Acutalibacteraceae bacterium]
MKNEKLSLLCDFYELAMSGGYYKTGLYKRQTYFDMFFRKVPDGGGFAIFAGLNQLIEYIKNLTFDSEDIAFLKSRNFFDSDFLDYLEHFKFTGSICAVPEGTAVFPNEPIVTVKAPAVEAQLIETFLLLCINHQSLIATKANRIARAANGKKVIELGSRRAQGISAAVEGARASFIGGIDGTSNTLACAVYDIPLFGTMAHSWVQMFDSEIEAFREFCKIYPNNATLLVDTFDTLKSGIPNAIRAFKEVLLPKGITDFAIRLDSGDIAYLSKKARKMLDNAGLTNCRIVVSNSLDEYIISDLLRQGAEVDIFGVGERLITSKSSPVFGGVYKLVAAENESGELIPKIKISDNLTKITNPHYKKAVRFFDKNSGKAVADRLCIFNEKEDYKSPIALFNPCTGEKSVIENYYAKDLLQPIFINGMCVYESPSALQIKEYCKKQVDTLPDSLKAFHNPHKYDVGLSEKLYNLKRELLENC